MRVVVVEPQAEPVVREIADGLPDMQAVIGTDFERLSPFSNGVSLICSESETAADLPMNRALRDENELFYGIIRGTFFCCGMDDESETVMGLTPEQEAFCLTHYRTPEQFSVIDGQLVCSPLAT